MFQIFVIFLPENAIFGVGKYVIDSVFSSSETKTFGPVCYRLLHVKEPLALEKWPGKFQTNSTIVGQGWVDELVTAWYSWGR